MLELKRPPLFEFIAFGVLELWGQAACFNAPQKSPCERTENREQCSSFIQPQQSTIHPRSVLYNTDRAWVSSRDDCVVRSVKMNIKMILLPSGNRKKWTKLWSRNQLEVFFSHENHWNCFDFCLMEFIWKNRTRPVSGEATIAYFHC